jgi:hypothetical protein
LLPVFAFVQRMMTTSGATGKTTSSASELEEGTVPVADPIVTAAMDAKDTVADAKSVSLPLTVNEGPGATGTAGATPVTALPPEPVHLTHAIPGLDVR